ncbi:ComF family protein [Sporosarcina sp. Marseille-Q4063]|uniref:ComF family protein n=1 Tax=Sporosarcina sp. Marseille-Q4063 TaxID=2810514 RepID=UPI002016939B|nr:phosphoribosyltransferase family protein [Sporosarcina sp. Marseille-Q4063]
MTECLLCDVELLTRPSWKSLLALDDEMVICFDCSSEFKRSSQEIEDTTLKNVTSLFEYNDAMRDYLHQYKFLQDIALAKVFKNDLHNLLKSKVNIIPIPMHPKRKVVRTFSHVEELLKRARISYSDVLEKKDDETMGEKSKKERLALSPLFKLKPNTIIKYEPYMLIDDIYTTGTTLRHAAALLIEAGAKEVEAVTLIRAKLND